MESTHEASSVAGVSHRCGRVIFASVHANVQHERYASTRRASAKTSESSTYEGEGSKYEGERGKNLGAGAA
jgi:hypothetical protein